MLSVSGYFNNHNNFPIGSLMQAKKNSLLAFHFLLLLYSFLVSDWPYWVFFLVDIRLQQSLQK